MIKSKFSITTHILTLLAAEGDWTTSNYIAGSINVNPVLVRKELALLKQYHFIESREGKNGGVRLAKSPADILLSDIFNLVKGEDHLFGFSKNTPNPACPIGREINKHLDQLYSDIDKTVELKLANTTLEEFSKQF